MKRIITGIILAIIITAIRPLHAQNNAEATGPAATRMSFKCISTSDDSIQLITTITVRREEGSKNLANALVSFYAAGKDDDVQIGESKTDVHGIARLKIAARNTYLRNEEQMLNLKSMYAGNENYEASESEFGLKPAKLKVSFYEEDSIRYVKVEGYQLNADGSETPVSGADVIVAVPKMFSNLRIAEITLGEDGTGTAEFPKNIIGDSLGNLTVIAFIEENDIFGNVRASADNNWGLHKYLISPDRPTRELWTPIAPLWMIITLIIMLLGVWGHYVYAMIQLFMINKSSKIPEKES